MSGLAAVLTLTVALVWLLEGAPHTASAQHDGMQPISHSHHGLPAGESHSQHANTHQPAECDASLIGCCVMHLCQPAISINEQDMVFGSRKDEAEDVSMKTEYGSAPEVTVPPPRVSSA